MQIIFNSKIYTKFQRLWNCDVISKCDESYEDIKKLFDKQDCGDISCEHGLNHGYNYIESEYHGYFLVRI